MTSYSLPKAAADGFSNARDYDAHRPSYPGEAVNQLLTRLGVWPTGGNSEPVHIVEIGAGTGKFTEELSRRAGAAGPPWTVVAVEPHAQMRAQLAAKKLPYITVVDGHASDLAVVADGWADAVIIAQAFHWFAHLDALKEIRRVLKPEASVGVIWNIEDYNKPADWPASTRWEQRLNDIVWSLKEDGNARFRDSKWQRAFAEAAQGGAPLFFPLEDARVPWTVQLTPDALWKRLLTLSQIANLPDTEEKAESRSAPPTTRKQFRSQIDDAVGSLDAQPDSKGELTVHAITYFAWARRA